MNEENLIQKLKDPSHKRMAFHELVITYQEKLYWHVRKIVIDHDDADDIMQNVFIKVWNSIDSFSFWSLSEDEYLVEKLHADDYFDGEQAQKMLMEAVVRLPEKQRLVFNMKYFDEMKYEEISEILNLTTGALKASYHHAVKKIEEFLNNRDN